MELPVDTLMEILHRLPTKSLMRFKCVAKSWERHICDSSTPYSCRSQRWKPNPRMIGFFYQPPSKNAPVNFLSSPKDTPKEDFDESVNFLGNTSLYIIASSKGFLLCSSREISHRHYYVYNPATRQYLTLPVTEMCVKNIAVGFNCKVDNSIEDVISFIIVRYKIPGRRQRSQSTMTIEIYSSQTNVWTTTILAIDDHLKLHPSYSQLKWLASAGAIDGVFCWLDGGNQIILYDSLGMSFWSLDSPEDYFGHGFRRFLGVSSGILCYALLSLENNRLIVWQLESNIRDRTPRWVWRYTELDVVRAINTCSEMGGRVNHIYYVHMEFHPAEAHIAYLNVNVNWFISYDMDNSSVKLVCDFGKGRYFNTFPYEWHEWPRLL